MQSARSTAETLGDAANATRAITASNTAASKPDAVGPTSDSMAFRSRSPHSGGSHPSRVLVISFSVVTPGQLSMP